MLLLAFISGFVCGVFFLPLLALGTVDRDED